ncbi:MAG: hypothetical protein R6T87_00465, partial [Marinobacter sp.]
MTDQSHESPEKTQDAPPRHKKPLRRRWWFWLLILLAVVLLLPLVLIGLILAALHTETGTAWTIDQVPGLQTEQGQGSLLGQWRAERLTWQGYGVGVVVDAPEVDWSPSCLFEKTLCLDTLKADRIAVTLQPSDTDDEAGGDISLPRVNLPIAVVVGDVALGPLTVNDGVIWDRFELSSRASGSSLDLEHVLYQLDDIRVTASGRADMRGDWPLDVDVDIRLPPPSGDDWHLAVNLGGSARDLRLSGTSAGYLAARLQGKVQPLDSRLPATFRLSTTAPGQIVSSAIELVFRVRVLLEQSIAGALTDLAIREGISALELSRAPLHGYSNKQGVSIRMPLSSCVPSKVCAAACYAH